MFIRNTYSVLDYEARDSGCNGLDDEGDYCRCSTLDESAVEICSIDLPGLVGALAGEEFVAKERGSNRMRINDAVLEYVACRLA